ncbi:hypothetical protein GCM10007874_11230 [Labrys miyagiensis]|uniref:DNA primase n=1 Tax=Labrys miyagiensis TaxID=346912 RepID=A0ABQ6CCM8_9HYPH|nr:hypothetical protein [Labrys miyagiensis]GLS18107.1 hypothetical protein GCM10007874_11230 [Labrys miyagiensis]
MLNFPHTHRHIDFDAVNAAARACLPALCARWLPGGKRHGREYFALNPRRSDRAPGSFAVNLVTGKWADFASGDRGGDVISLAAFVFNLSQIEAARRVAEMLGIEV